MTLARSSGHWSPVRLVTHGLQALLVALAAYALVSLSVGELLNVGIPLAIAATPTVLRRVYGYRVNPVVGLWIALSAALHVVGTFGPYQNIGWYDQVAHAVSASLVAGIGYAVFRALDRDHEGIVIPTRLQFVFLFVFATAFGVLWEIAEFGTGLVAAWLGGDPVLAQYGLDDAVYDLLFNAVGAVLVAVFGTDYFRSVTRMIERSSDS